MCSRSYLLNTWNELLNTTPLEDFDKGELICIFRKYILKVHDDNESPANSVDDSHYRESCLGLYYFTKFLLDKNLCRHCQTLGFVLANVEWERKTIFSIFYKQKEYIDIYIWSILEFAEKIGEVSARAVMKSILSVGSCVLEKSGEIVAVMARMSMYAFFLEDVKKYFSSEYEGEMISLDGDFHCNMKHPILIQSAKGSIVFKPRDMRVDREIYQIYKEFMEMIEPDDGIIGCPIEVTLLTERPNNGTDLDENCGGNTGVMPFLDKSKGMNYEQAKKYFRNLGALLGWAQVFGVGDLHYENILATDSGPVIIDAEVAFQYDIIKKNKMHDGALDDLIDKIFELDSSANVIPAILFSDNGNRQNADVVKDLLLQMVDGFSIIQKKLQTDDVYEFVKDKFNNFIQSQIPVRIVPVRTSDFYRMMFFFITGGRDGSLVNAVCSIIVETLKIFDYDKELDEQKLIDFVFGYLDGANDEELDNDIQDKLSKFNIKFDRLLWALKNDFCIGCVPILHICNKVENVEVYIDDIENPFMTIPNLTRQIQIDKFTEHLNWMKREKALESFKEWLKIETLPNDNGEVGN